MALGAPSCTHRCMLCVGWPTGFTAVPQKRAQLMQHHSSMSGCGVLAGVGLVPHLAASKEAHSAGAEAFRLALNPTPPDTCLLHT